MTDLLVLGGAGSLYPLLTGQQSCSSDLTIIRPAWFTNGHDIEYELTHKNEAFLDSSVSRMNIADLINCIVVNPELYLRESLGVARI